AAGDLERLLWQTADYCQRRSAQYAARMEALAEPVMTVFIAAVIFFAVLSFLLPVFDAMDALM
ncbi:type II secretion system F family protein, partial [Selenomonas noxia]